MIEIVKRQTATTGRTRAWAIVDSNEGELAEVTTKRGAQELKTRLEATAGAMQAGQEPGATFVLHLAQTLGGWSLMDSVGRVRASSPNRQLLADNVDAIGDALIQSAQMTSRLADVGVVVSSSVAWAVRA